VEKVAHSKYAGSTLIFMIEDDAQNGPDHVDAHRSLAFVVGPFVKHGALISERYNTVSLLRTIEEVLGIRPLGLNDAVQSPMTEICSNAQSSWPYQPRVPAALRATKLPIPAEARASSYQLRHDAEYWEQQTSGMDFSAADRLDVERFNLILWKGMMGDDQPYPVERSGRDLKHNRKELLRKFSKNAQDPQ